MNPLQVVSGIIENDRGEVLLAERPPGKLLAGAWEFPGGKIEAGEEASAALERELAEELGLRIEIRKFLGEFPFAYDWGVIVLHVFVVRALNTPQPSADVQVFRWTSPEAVDRALLAGADVQPLEIYLQDLRAAQF